MVAVTAVVAVMVKCYWLDVHARRVRSVVQSTVGPKEQVDKMEQEGIIAMFS